MPSEKNKAVVRRLLAGVLAKGNEDVRREIFSADTIGIHTPGGKLVRRGQPERWWAAFPDLTQTIDMLIGEGDLVMARWTLSGTHLGELRHPLWGAIPPTGKHGTWSGVNIYRLVDGKIVETWLHRDDLSLLQQLGVTAGESPGNPAIRHHPRRADASPERLREVLGSISLTGPVPSWRFLDDDEEDEEPREQDRSGSNAGQ